MTYFSSYNWIFIIGYFNIMTCIENKSVCVCVYNLFLFLFLFLFSFFFFMVNTKFSLVDKESCSRVNIGPYYNGINIGPILSIGPNGGNKARIE